MNIETPITDAELHLENFLESNIDVTDFFERCVQELDKSEMELLILISKKRKYKEIFIDISYHDTGKSKQFFYRKMKKLKKAFYIVEIDKKIMINLFKYPCIKKREINRILKKYEPTMIYDNK